MKPICSGILWRPQQGRTPIDHVVSSSECPSWFYCIPHIVWSGQGLAWTGLWLLVLACTIPYQPCLSFAMLTCCCLNSVSSATFWPLEVWEMCIVHAVFFAAYTLGNPASPGRENFPHSCIVTFLLFFISLMCRLELLNVLEMFRLQIDCYWDIAPGAVRAVEVRLGW